MSSKRLRRSAALFVSLAVGLTAACGSSDDDAASDTTAAPAVESSAAAPDSSAAPAETTTTADADAEAWEALVDAAKEEGKVTIYSSQGLDQLNAFAAEFEKVYPEIDVEVARLTDNDSTAKVDNEKLIGSLTADMWVINSQTTMEGKAQEGGWFVAPTGPQFQAPDYLAEYIHDGDYFEVGAAVLTFGWNTDRLPDGISGYPDLLGPEFAGGQVAVIDANVSPAAVDFYLYLEETYGADYVEKLAAQDPRIYPSALPIGEALGAGEVAAAAFTLPLIAQMEAGAPVDFAIADTAWGTRFFGSILDGAPHPNAAQLLADFMVSPEGQAAVQKNQASVLPDIPGTLTTNDKIRMQDLTALTPERVAEYQAKWNALFQ